MRVSREKAAQNRIAILQAASHLFRKRGIDGVGVAEIAKEAGLTHGALYAHFPSKDALVAEAFSHGFQGNMAANRGAGRQSLRIVRRVPRRPPLEIHARPAGDGLSFGRVRQ